MKVVKYKKLSNGRYKVQFDNGRDMELYEDVILKYELLLNKQIDSSKLFEMSQYNQEWDVYYVALKTLRARYKSTKELREWLFSKNYPQELVDIAICKLRNQGYVDDRNFAKSYIHSQIATTMKGPNKIRKELSSKGVEDAIIISEIEVFDQKTQEEKIRKLIAKQLQINRSRGGEVLKKKIASDLVSLGYDIFLVQQLLLEYDFSIDSSLAKKEYDKLYRRLSRKYTGKELEYKIKEKLYQKGLYYEN